MNLFHNEFDHFASGRWLGYRVVFDGSLPRCVGGSGAYFLSSGTFTVVRVSDTLGWASTGMSMLI